MMSQQDLRETAWRLLEIHRAEEKISAIPVLARLGANRIG